MNSLLTSVSLAYRNEEAGYIADRVFPLVPVDKQTDIYASYNRGYFHADEGQRMIRAPGTRAATTGFLVDLTGTYRAENYAIGYEIPDELRANADLPLNMDRDAAMLLSDLQRIRRERAFAADWMTTGKWTGSSTGSDITVGSKWSDYGASDPIGDIRLQIDAIEAATGQRPNKAVMGAIVWRRIQDHPDFIDRIKGGATPGSPAMVNQQMLAAMLGLNEVLVARASYRTSDEGVAVTLARIIDDDVLLLYAPPSPSLLTPAAGYTFFWRPLTGGGIEFVRRGRAERERYDWIENHSYFDHVQTSALSGAFFADVVD